MRESEGSLRLCGAGARPSRLLREPSRPSSNDPAREKKRRASALLTNIAAILSAKDYLQLPRQAS
jgi:hypothetical protein